MKKLFILAITAVGLLACTGKNTPDNPDKSINPSDSATISCSSDTIIAGESGGKFIATISSKSEWSATANNTWVTISPNSGQGDAFVTINVADGEKDEARVLFSNGESSTTLVVYRENISCDPTIKEVTENSEEFSVNIKTHASWTATSDKSSVTITPESGYGDAIVGVNVSSGNYDEVCVTFSCATSSATLIIRPRIRYEGGLLPGKFSVSASKQVQFSQGNLQYKACTRTWRFAYQQFAIIGNDNANIDTSYDGWIDLFGWGTGNNPTNLSKDDNDYSTYIDWGEHAISNGGNGTNLWRTLTKEELYYLFYTRTNAANLFGLGSVNDINGIIILPDNWVTPQGASFTPSTTVGLADQGSYYKDNNRVHYSDNTYTVEQWSVMEQSGAVFLPAAGDRQGRVVYSVSSFGGYWSATPCGGLYAYYLQFHGNELYLRVSFDRYVGLSVRLVR